MRYSVLARGLANKHKGRSVKVLVTGGCGYIGSFVTRRLQERGHEAIILDNMVLGHREAVKAPVEAGDLADRAFVQDVFQRHRPKAVMHLAAWIEVGESVTDPAKYFSNNTGNAANLLEIMARAGVEFLVFSSTAAVYGTPEKVPISETAPAKPDSPYGLSKLLTDMSLCWYEHAQGPRTISLRYFNAAGGALDGSAGQDHEPATHLITNAIKGALGQTDFKLFGDDYPTPDGTCIRDYIHVLDIAEAHLVALDHLASGGSGRIYNVGTGVGHSNREVIEVVKQISGIDFPVGVGPRRPGDPSELVADASLLRRELGWQPQYSSLDTIVESAWRWHSTHPHGYATT